MTEITLTVVIAILCGLIGWSDYNNRKERKSLLNALKSKDAIEMANLDLADKTQVKVEVPKPSDLIPPENLSQEDWEKAIKQ